jgi:hypothetical protein
VLWRMGEIHAVVIWALLVALLAQSVDTAHDWGWWLISIVVAALGAGLVWLLAYAFAQQLVYWLRQ